MLSCMKRIWAIAALPLALGACSTTPEPVIVTATAIVDPDSGGAWTTVMGEPAAPSQVEADASALDWQSEYAGVLDHAGAYEFDVPNPAGIDTEFVPTGEYDYALVEATGGGAPELLLSQWSIDSSSSRFARVLMFTVDSGSLTQSSNALTYGAAGAGGFRAGVDASQLGRGIYQTQWSSGTGDQESTWCELDGSTIAAAAESQKIWVRHTPPLHLVIDWTPITDRGPLEAGELTVSNPEDTHPAPVDGPAEVISGTVVRKTAAELEPDGTPNGESADSEYFLLEMDSPREFTDHHHAGSVYSDTAEYVYLGRREWTRYEHIDGTEWEALVGERVTLTVDPSFIGFQTDASMPMGALRVSRYESVEIDS